MRPPVRLVPIMLVAGLLGVVPVVSAMAGQETPPPSVRPEARFTEAAAFDVSPSLRDLAAQPRTAAPRQLPPERGPVVKDQGFTGDGAVQSTVPVGTNIPDPLITFEGLRNTDNPFLVTPPDPVGDVGPNHYVEMVNLVFGVYSKTGTLLLGPLDLGTLWAGFEVPDCADDSGDPIVLYDQLANRWLLTQFTTAGPTFYNCVAISTTGNPTGTYYRYAFSSGVNFPDYPKYGVWTHSYLLTTREFGPVDEYGIGVYALERSRMIVGDPNARVVSFFLDSLEVPINLIGDGLLPADIDGTTTPANTAAAPIIGTQDDGGPYGAPFDALNVFDLRVKWKANPIASLELATQIPVAAFDSIFPCTGGGRACIPQPGTSVKIDILSYRQRPTWRLAYRRFSGFETMVTNQSVEALPGIAGVRWYEVRRSGGVYSLYQQGTYAPNDGVHRWMGSIAMDRRGSMALGYSVSNGTNVFPGIRYTGRLKRDPLGQMSQGEGVIINGGGSQLISNFRWGDYTSMNVDPTDDCTFWYVNEYYQVTSQNNWQTRIGSFRLPGC